MFLYDAHVHVDVWHIISLSTSILAGDSTPSDINVVVTVAIDNNVAVLNWEIESLRNKVTRLEILISRIEPLTASEVDVSLVLTHNITDLNLTESCFSNLNSTDTYQFCVQAYTESGMAAPIQCEFGRATGDSSDQTNSRACVPIAPERVSSDPGMTKGQCYGTGLWDWWSRL